MRWIVVACECRFCRDMPDVSICQEYQLGACCSMYNHGVQDCICGNGSSWSSRHVAQLDDLFSDTQLTRPKKDAMRQPQHLAMGVWNCNAFNGVSVHTVVRFVLVRLKCSFSCLNAIRIRAATMLAESAQARSSVQT